MKFELFRFSLLYLMSLMVNSLTKNKFKEYQKRLLASFPAELKSDVESVAKILPLQKNDVQLCDGKIHTVDNLIHSNELTIKLNGEQLIIPSRLYFDEPDVDIESDLTDRQKAILSCIF